jgi:hypothetical protein
MNSIVYEVSADLPRSVVFTSPAGGRATIDFSGDALRVTGDLPLDEAALELFEYMQGMYNSERRRIERLEARIAELESGRG